MAQSDLRFAQTLALRFGIVDFWQVLQWPRELVAYWRARYELEPWDMANRLALAQAKYEAPKWLTRKGRFMTVEEVLASARNR